MRAARPRADPGSARAPGAASKAPKARAPHLHLPPQVLHIHPPPQLPLVHRLHGVAQPRADVHRKAHHPKRACVAWGRGEARQASLGAPWALPWMRAAGSGAGARRQRRRRMERACSGAEKVPRGGRQLALGALYPEPNPPLPDVGNRPLPGTLSGHWPWHDPGSRGRAGQRRARRPPRRPCPGRGHLSPWPRTSVST